MLAAVPDSLCTKLSTDVVSNFSGPMLDNGRPRDGVNTAALLMEAASRSSRSALQHRQGPPGLAEELLATEFEQQTMEAGVGESVFDEPDPGHGDAETHDA